MTSTASLHFGPEWMRKPTRPSPVSPATNGIITNSTHPTNGITSVNGHHTGSTAGAATTNSSPANTLLTGSSYSSLLASPAPPEPLSDSSNPFRYSREQMYNVWKNGGGQGELGLEVERWPGIVREDAIQPLGLTEYSPDEKRLYALPYNSDPPPVRRRGDSYSAQSPLATTPGGLDPTRDRNKLANPSRGFGTPGSIGSVGAGSGSSSLGMGLPSRRKKDENGQDIPVYRPRQLSLGASGNQTGPPSPGGAAPPGNTLTRARLSGTGFDGVMQDSWAGAARRRVSEPRAPNTTNRGEDKLEGSWRRDDSRYRDEITEEPVADWEQAADSEAPPTDSSTSKDTSDPMSRPESARQSTPNTDLSIPIESHLPNGATALPSTADLQNPEEVSWCYKDPTGQVQGPFSASTMQSWYLGSYFTDDLLLKRVDIDPDFEELQDFKRRVLPPGTPETLFLSRIAAKPPVIPPGLPNPVGPGPVHPLGQLPASLGRSDPFAHDSAGVITSPIVSDPQSYPSPTISGAPFGNAFPQLGGLGIGGFGNDIDRQRREREDFLRSLREKELASRGVGVPAIGGIGSPLGGLDIPNGTPLGSNGLVGGVFPNSFASPEPFVAQSPIQSFGQPSPFGVNGLGAHQLQAGGLDSFYNPITPQNQQQPIWPRTPHSGIPEQASTFGQTPVAVTPSWMSIIEQQPPASQFDAAAAAFHNAPVQQPTFGVATPWNQQTTIEAPIPSVISEVLNQTPIEVAADTQEPTALEEEPQDLHPDPVESELIDPSTAVIAADNDDLETGLKAMDLNQAPVPEEVKQAIVQEETTVPTTVPTPKKSQKQSAPPATKSTSAAPTPTVSTISQSGVSVASTRSAISTASPSAVEPEQPAATTSSTAPKTVWTNFAEEPKPSSLRKIQEAEAKRAAEAKKVEKERAKNASATAVASPASTTASVAEATGSWGLPQVGRAPTASAPSPAPSTGSAGGVWATKPTQVTKKSMKEIQDEEEKRKKAAAQAQAAAAAATAAASAPPVAASAAKRGYADSAKPTSGATPSQPNGWTTIGSSGKAVAPATPVPAASNVARPAPTTSRPSTANVPGASAPSSSTSKPAAKPVPSNAKSADEIPPPSLEFIRWMRDALRGLTGANVDEFMQMLLSFPLDPSPTVVEIISDSVYASSATLDGRRFASEFVAKRKADAANAKAQDAKQAGAWAGRVSVADVVKTQPKAAESEWSTRVVKKNKKSRGNGGNGN